VCVLDVIDTPSIIRLTRKTTFWGHIPSNELIISHSYLCLSDS
jgi:hypothetical protein